MYKKLENMKKILIPLIIFIALCINAFASVKSNKELKGDKRYASYSFTKAINAYTNAKALTPEGQRRLAESYSRINKNAEAETAYSTLVSTPEGVVPEDYYRYAMVLKANGKYEQSNNWMDKFVAIKPTDLRAKSFAANKKELANLSKDDGKYKLTTMTANSDDRDFGPAYYNNKIVFASNRETPGIISRKSAWTGKPFLDLYMAEVEAGQLKDPENFDRNLNSKMHDGPASFSNDGTCMAYTVNNYKDKSKDRVVELRIFFSNYVDGKWSKPEGFALNNPGYSVGHPCLTADGNTMYFTSDMPGGFGGADIYRITKVSNGTWGKAENMGDKINTEGNEMFPFFEENNGVLFFASDGHYGLGGLDVFICMLNGTEAGKMYNAGSPLNTRYDDFSVIVNKQASKGYFASNRVGGSGDDDIYAFDLLRSLNVGKRIEGVAKDNNGNSIPRTFVTLLDNNGVIVNTITTNDEGAFTFLVDPDKIFKLIGNKENYTEGTSAASTFGSEFIVKADVTLLLKTVAKMDVGDDLATIVVFNPNKIYFDVDQFAIRPDAEKELKKIVDIMNEYPSMIVELRAHTDCRAPKEYNQILSEKRATASAEYIRNRIVNPERIYGKGYGETKLANGCECEGEVVSTCSNNEQQKNRRTEFIIVRK